MALPFFAEFGWEPLILKIDPDEQEGIRDPMLCATVPKATRTWQSGAIGLRWTSWFGLRSVGLRSFFHLAKLGSRIIRDESPAVVFFSTTMFPVMILGRYWRWRHGVPYVMDYQDPWRNDSVRDVQAPLPLKQRLSILMAAILEPLALRRVGHVVSVSPQYPVSLAWRYSWLRLEDFSVLPFGAAEGDFALLPSIGVRQSIFSREDGKRHWVYVGRGGADMAFAARAFFLAMRKAREAAPSRCDDVAVHFIGTDYAPAEKSRKTIEPVAIECGVGDMVEEMSLRIPYFEALCCLQDADALIVLGSDDSGYTASKIYPYILANKPLLAIFHEKSSVVELVRATRSGVMVTFNGSSASEAVAAEIGARWFGGDDARSVDTDWNAFAPCTARQMTRRLCGIFDTLTAAR
jgi:hypothetical protein